MCMTNSPTARPSLDQYFMSLALLVATRSTWPGMKVGCVIVKDKQVLSTGYNGTPHGWKNDLGREEKRFYSHAEQNVIAQAARHGTNIKDSSAYVTISPCAACASLLVNAGVK